MDNLIGPVDQRNAVEAFDNSVSDQGNNVAISQDLLADNDCNGTGGNSVQCTNDGFIHPILDIDDFNFIDSIEQGNAASLADDVSSVQLNDAAVDQGGALVNTCDETGGGINQALCENVDNINILGPVSQSNSVDASTFNTAAQTADQSNGLQVTQNLQAVNDCDEDDTGFNLASCVNDQTSSEIESITQDNDATVGDDTVQLNFVAINQDLLLQNVCDETGIGDNNAQCNDPDSADDSNNFIGPVTSRK